MGLDDVDFPAKGPLFQMNASQSSYWANVTISSRVVIVSAPKEAFRFDALHAYTLQLRSQ